MIIDILLFQTSFSFSFNRLDIPNYEVKNVLYEKMTWAVEETCGFNIE